MFEWLLDALLLPALWLSLGLGLICGLIFYLWRRGGWRRFWRDLAAGVVGFAAGHVIAGLAGNEQLLIGQVQVIPGMVGAALILSAGRLVQPDSTGR